MSNALANKYIRRRPLIRSDFLHCKKSHCLNFGNCCFSKVVRGFLNRIFGAASLVTFSMLQKVSNILKSQKKPSLLIEM